MSDNGIEVKIPNVGESIRDVQIGKWLKHEGDHVERDETIVELETDKASMDLPAPSRGVITKILKQDGELVAVGEVIARLDASETPAESTPSGTPNATPASAPKKQPAAAAGEKPSGKRDDAAARPVPPESPTGAAQPIGPSTARFSESAAAAAPAPAPTSALSAPAQAIGPVKPPYESRPRRPPIGPRRPPISPSNRNQSRSRKSPRLPHPCVACSANITCGRRT